MNYRGLGAPNAQLTVYIENTPPLEEYQQLHYRKLMTYEDILDINRQAGNGWRKIFNVYAKFLFELCPVLPAMFTTWQEFREQALLQSQSNHCLLMSQDKPSFHQRQQQANNVHIIAGKGYAEKLGVAESSHWLTPHFAIDEIKQVIVCPFFDYRQLTNERITMLCRLVRQVAPDYQALSPLQKEH